MENSLRIIKKLKLILIIFQYIKISLYGDLKRNLILLLILN
ncbi:hypothetical protein HDEF_1796 [Candidatus Hamiltonella defensa 5AT (Acyrthosiphon pisum)]|uniref:Uncharacterized protein n=1 Tax=Hamiltonella defensa subsp. Acyrthosiphon pisum (strain 5AT) TaxID=572265 RepID=C4K749_HAMD5|nr:hypothetical protein HDEF_1796 [Candidatus Hamiltonella defensa 5AT (Acyrthosiphon pisum)]